MRVEEFLRTRTRRRPGKTALVAGKLRPTFKDLDLASDRLAATLAAKGIKVANAGGFSEWEAAGLPTRKVDSKTP